MSELPKGWISKKLEDIVQKIDKIDPVSQPEDFSFKYIDISGIDSQSNRVVDSKELLGKDAPSRARHLVLEGDVLFSTVRTYLKNIAQVPRELDGQVASTGFAVLRTGFTTLNRLLYYYVLSDGFLDPLNALQRGISYPAVTNKNVLSQEIPLPPLNEQKRIVAKLDLLFAHLDGLNARLERVPELLKQFRQSVLTQAVTGKLILKEELKEKSLGELGIKIETGPFGSALHKKDYISEGIPVINPSHIINNEIIPNSLITISKAKAEELQRWILEEGDVVLGRRGEMGRSAVVPNKARMLCGTGSMVLRNTNSIEPKFLMYFLCSPPIIRFLEEGAVGSTMINLNQKVLKALVLPDYNLEEQKEIVRRVEALFEKVDLIEQQYELLKEKIDHLPQAILAKAFRGELVPQDPNDEPAEELLHNIQRTKSNGLPKQEPVAKAPAVKNGQASVSKKNSGEQMKLEL